MATILIVDDDVALLERLATLLGQAGYTTLRANRVQYAELLLAEQRPDLIVLDPDTGGGDGWVLLGAAQSAAPVLIVSGQGLEEDIIRGLEAGAVDYMTKPFGTAELLARIKLRLRERERSALGGAPLTPEAPIAAPATSPPAPPATGPTTPLQPAEPRERRARGARAPGDDEEPVFIPYGEEERLLRDVRSATSEDLGDIAQLPLGQRLHAARQRKRLTLVQAELETRPSVPMHYIQAMEEEKFSLLPRGPVAEELLRTYAAYVGVDIAAALDEYRRVHYIEPIEPPDSLGGAPAQRRAPTWLISVAAAILAVAVGCGGIWLYDPASVRALGQRAGLLAAPPALPTVAPTAAPQPTSSPAPTLAPTTAPTAAPTAAPTLTPAPTLAPTAPTTPTPTPR
jgi:DNA-binding response OmpR family regulator